MDMENAVIFWLLATGQLEVISIENDVIVTEVHLPVGEVSVSRDFIFDDDSRIGFDLAMIRNWVNDDKVQAVQMEVSSLAWSLELWEPTPQESYQSVGIVVIPPLPYSAMKDYVPVDGMVALREAVAKGYETVEVFVLTPRQTLTAYREWQTYSGGRHG